MANKSLRRTSALHIIEDLQNFRKSRSRKTAKNSKSTEVTETDPLKHTFLLTENANHAVDQYRRREVNFIRFKINFTNAEVDKDVVASIDEADDLAALIPIFSTSIVLYRFVHLEKEFSIVIFAKVTDEDLLLNLKNRGHGDLKIGKFQFEQSFVEKLEMSGVEADYSIDTSYGIQIDEQRLIDTVVSGLDLNRKYWLVSIAVFMFLFCIPIILR